MNRTDEIDFLLKFIRSLALSVELLLWVGDDDSLSNGSYGTDSGFGTFL